MIKLLAGSSAVRIAGAAGQLGFTILVTHAAGSDQAGQFFLGFSILMILSTLSRVGCELSGLRGVATAAAEEDPSTLRAIVTTRIWVVLGVGVILGCALAASATTLAGVTLGSRLVPTLLVVAATVAPFAVLNLVAELLKGLGSAVLAISLQNLVVPSVSGAGVVILWAGSVSVSAFWLSMLNAIAVLVGVVFAFAALRVAARDQTNLVGGLREVSRSEALSIVREAPSLLVVSMVIVVMQWIGATVLGVTGSAADVAGYGVAARISIAVSIVHSAASSVVAPKMAAAHASGDIDGLARVSQRTGLLIAAMTWPVLFALFVGAPFALSVFGPEFGAYSDVLRVLLAGQFVAGLIGHSGMVLVMAGAYRDALLNSMSAVAAILLLSPVLTASYGAVGAASAMSSAVVLGHLVAVMLARRRLGIWTVGTGRLPTVRGEYA